jgi:hypothetical protein
MNGSNMNDLMNSKACRECEQVLNIPSMNKCCATTKRLPDAMLACTQAAKHQKGWVGSTKQVQPHLKTKMNATSMRLQHSMQ